MSTSSKPAFAALECVSALSGQAVLAISRICLPYPSRKRRATSNPSTAGNSRPTMTTSGMERFTLRQRGFAVVRDQRAVTGQGKASIHSRSTLARSARYSLKQLVHREAAGFPKSSVNLCAVFRSRAGEPCPSPFGLGPLRSGTCRGQWQ